MCLLPQVVSGLKALLNPGNGLAVNSNVSYTTATAFVQALARSQDNKGDTSSVSPQPVSPCGREILNTTCL